MMRVRDLRRMLVGIPDHAIVTLAKDGALHEILRAHGASAIAAVGPTFDLYVGQELARE